jgi:hypothetical protein
MRSSGDRRRHPVHDGGYRRQQSAHANAWDWHNFESFEDVQGDGPSGAETPNFSAPCATFKTADADVKAEYGESLS